MRSKKGAFNAAIDASPQSYPGTTLWRKSQDSSSLSAGHAHTARGARHMCLYVGTEYSPPSHRGQRRTARKRTSWMSCVEPLSILSTCRDCQALLRCLACGKEKWEGWCVGVPSGSRSAARAQKCGITTKNHPTTELFYPKITLGNCSSFQASSFSSLLEHIPSSLFGLLCICRPRPYSSPSQDL